jgi:hypothetical protein
MALRVVGHPSSTRRKYPLIEHPGRIVRYDRLRRGRGTPISLRHWESLPPA